MNIYFETYGCAANQNNTEIMSGLVKKAGHKITELNNAEIVVINSCIVKGPTENKVKSRILKMQKLGKIVIVAGCMPNLRKNELKLSRVYLLGTKNILDLPKLLSSMKNILIDKCEVKISKEKIPKNKVIGITQISEGCLGNCTYCATKLAKGDLYSFSESDILASIKNDIKNGCKEIWITSQDNSAYGLDKGKYRLPELLRKILKIDNEFYLRIGMMNPNHLMKFKDEMIEIFKDPKVYKFLHIPCQSGSNKILKEMNRSYTSEEFIELAKDFKKHIPNITFSTDIIVGFPGETEKDFQDSLEILKMVRPGVLNLSRYWAMRGTKAANMKQVPSEVSKKRAAKTQFMFKSLIDNSGWIGWQGQALVNEKTKQGFFARNSSYKRILIKSKKDIFGKFLDIKISSLSKNYLLGNIIKNKKDKNK